LTILAFRSPRGRVGGFTFLVMSVLVTVGLSACGAPAWTYVADSSAQAYYKVPYQWHQISQTSLNSAVKAAGGTTAGAWARAFDANAAPQGSNFLDGDTAKPFVFSEVGGLSSTISNELSYNVLRDFMLPVTSDARTQDAQEGFSLTDFKSLRDQTITGKQGVHGVRETFDYTFPDGKADTFDEVVLTNSNNTQVYFLLVHCTETCYSQNQGSIDTVMTSFTIGSPT
jgi:hypothetical protein